MKILIVEKSRVARELVEIGLAYVTRNTRSVYHWDQANPESVVINPSLVDSEWLPEDYRDKLDDVGLSPELVAGGVSFQEGWDQVVQGFQSNLWASWDGSEGICVKHLYWAKTGDIIDDLTKAMQSRGLRPVGRTYTAPDRALNVAHLLADLLQERLPSE